MVLSYQTIQITGCFSRNNVSWKLLFPAVYQLLFKKNYCIRRNIGVRFILAISEAGIGNVKSLPRQYKTPPVINTVDYFSTEI